MIVVTYLLALVAALGFHETGHLVTARLLGYPATFVVHRLGIGTQWGSDARISPRHHRVAVSLAGPLVSLLTAVLFAWSGQDVLALVSLVVGISNLLPFGESDGAHAWHAATEPAHLTRIA